MEQVTLIDWQTANQRSLVAALDIVRKRLQIMAGDVPIEGLEAARHAWEEAEEAMPIPSSLTVLCSAFGLSAFERDILVLCAGFELDASFFALCDAAQGNLGRSYPTFSLALAALPDPHWSALLSSAPPRYWHLIEVDVGPSLTRNPLRIDERALHFLTGIQQLDQRLIGMVEPLLDEPSLVPSHMRLAERAAETWTRTASGRLPMVQLYGGDAPTRRAIAAAACIEHALIPYLLPAEFIPSSPDDLETLTRLWNREERLTGCALILDVDEADLPETIRPGLLGRFLDRLHGHVIVSAREHLRLRGTPTVVLLDVPRPTVPEQRNLWRAMLGASADRLNGKIDALVSQFSLSASDIGSVAARALATGDGESEGMLWDACRAQARPAVGELAERIDPRAGWNDVVLPLEQVRTLREIAAHVRHRARVYETWGFASRGPRGLGISALFVGDSGTGKTLAAEVLAADLRLDLYHIDLSQVVSKYIGETEKNLRRVFDAAEAGGAVLLFDEADALFGKRSEVKDSHDRYANIEVSYLLQRMEAYRGLAILTTNMKSALDPAFLRRIRFIVQFPFPDMQYRAEIWRRIFPADMPTRGLDVQQLARLNIPGGNIRNIAIGAAFLAADMDEPVGMTHLLQAAHTEYLKLEKPLTEVEIGGWA